MLTKNPTFGQRNALRQPEFARRPSQQATSSQASSAAAAIDKRALTPETTVAGEPGPEVVELTPSEPSVGMAMTSQSSTGGAEARWARRSPSRLGAQILHASLSPAILCTIRDTSSTGARLEVTAQRGGNVSRDRVPDQFTLFMPADRLEVDCEVMWRQGPMVGVRYTSPTRRTAKQQPLKRPELPKKPHTSLVKLLINPM